MAIWTLLFVAIFALAAVLDALLGLVSAFVERPSDVE
jgi:hypothetical protein